MLEKLASSTNIQDSGYVAGKTSTLPGLSIGSGGRLLSTAAVTDMAPVTHKLKDTIERNFIILLNHCLL